MRFFCIADMKKYNSQILPFIVDILQDRSSPISREDALQSLGQLVSSTGYVVETNGVFGGSCWRVIWRSTRKILTPFSLWYGILRNSFAVCWAFSYREVEDSEVMYVKSWRTFLWSCDDLDFMMRCLYVSLGSLVIEPYNQHKKLLPTILSLLGGEHPWQVRKEVRWRCSVVVQRSCLYFGKLTKLPSMLWLRCAFTENENSVSSWDIFLRAVYSAP